MSGNGLVPTKVEVLRPPTACQIRNIRGKGRESRKVAEEVGKVSGSIAFNICVHTMMGYIIKK